MKVTATVVVEIDDESYQRVSAMFRDVTPQSLVHTLLTTGLDREISANGGILGYTVDVESYSAPVGGVYEAPDLSGVTFDASTATLSAPRRSGGMTGGARSASPVTGRTGRPPTLHDMEASDGGPVRAAGPRSADELAKIGVSVRPVGGNASDWTPPLRTKRSRTEEIAASKPIRQGYSGPTGKPNVVAKRRGK